MSVFDLVIGKPLATSEERAEQIGPVAGIPIFGLDALSSAAYGPEAALTLLIPLGLAGVQYIVPISLAIIVLLAIVFFSYLQTIDAYPHGGGSYTVASENLGEHAGLLAAAALMIDYILNSAVGISAGVGALVSAFPRLQPHTLALCLAILLILSLINMRGVKDTGAAFLLPTYLFLGTLLLVLVVGAVRALAAGGHPAALVAPPRLPRGTSLLPIWLLLKVFASGCTAMTGVEAVSNGVNAFREPTQKNAKRTLAIVIVLLMVFLAGIALLCRAYGIAATAPGSSGYQSILSQLIAAVMGRGWFYYLSIGSILTVLALSANTSYADFPRLTRAIAERDYLPHVFKIRGRRLLYSHGIYALVGFTALLLIVFGGITDRLIPLYAVGAFLAFTLSQAGMVMHWKRRDGSGSGYRMIVNGIGAVATFITLVVVLIAKFTAGAWITALLVPALILTMSAVKRHYNRVSQEIVVDRPLNIDDLVQPLVIVPLDRWTRITEKGLRFALKLSDSVEAVHVDAEDCCDEVKQMWQRNVVASFSAANKPLPRLVLLTSPYRFVITPLVDHILQVEQPPPPDRRPRPRAGRQTLVADSPPQPARPTPQTTPAAARQSAHHGHQHPLVPAGPGAKCTQSVWPKPEPSAYLQSIGPRTASANPSVNCSAAGRARRPCAAARWPRNKILKLLVLIHAAQPSADAKTCTTFGNAAGATRCLSSGTEVRLQFQSALLPPHLKA